VFSLPNRSPNQTRRLLMLGELYRPKGPALETAQQVLEIKQPFACNVAWGCSNCCKYPCYNAWRTKGKVRLPRYPPLALVGKQVANGLMPEGVFSSFGTDPFLPSVELSTRDLVNFLLAKGIKVATLTKMVPYCWSLKVRFGITIVSLDEQFRKTFEPNTSSIKERLKLLHLAHIYHGYTWASLEPYPPPAIWKQDLRNLLNAISFVDFMIFGKWNYDKRANTHEAREFYRSTLPEFEDFCKAHRIRYWVKSGTRKFCEEAS